jgi:hypothetical protein
MQAIGAMNIDKIDNFFIDDLDRLCLRQFQSSKRTIANFRICGCRIALLAVHQINKAKRPRQLTRALEANRLR